MQPVVIFAPLAWDVPARQRPHHLAQQLAARGHPVQYVEPGQPEGSRQVAPGLTVRGEGASAGRRGLSAWLDRMPASDALRTRIQSSGWYRNYRAQLAIPSVDAEGPGVVLVQFPYFAPQALALQRAGWRLVYDRLDPWPEMPGVGQTAVAYDALLYARADRVSVTHERLAQGPMGLDRPVTRIPNGVDLEHFDPKRVHAARQAKDRPVAGYVGTLGPWFDWPRVIELARDRPDWDIRIMGPGDAPTGLPRNVRLTGPVNHDELPGHLALLDVGLIPFREGRLREAVDPVKAYEYLAMGVPVLSSPLDALEDLPGVTLAEHGWPEQLDRLKRARFPRKAVNAALQVRSWTVLTDRLTSLFDTQDPGPLLSVVVPSHNGAAHLERCLGSLAKQTLDDLELIVVDDGSTDDSAAMVRQRFPTCRLIQRASNGGFAAATNDGILASRGTFVALLNNDTEVDPGWAAALVEAFDDPDIGAVAAYLYQMDRRERVDRAGDGYAVSGGAFNREHNRLAAHVPGRREEIFGASAAAAAYRRAALVEAGLLDVSFEAYYEDVDLAWRLRLLGWRCVLCHDAVGWHQGNASYARGGNRCVRNSSRNSEVVFWSVLPGELLLRYWPAHLSFLALQAIHRLTRGELGPFVEGKMQFLANMPEVLARRKRVQATRRASHADLRQPLERRWIRSVVGGWSRRS